MARMKSMGGSGGGGGAYHPSNAGITAETYAKEAEAYCKRSGRENGTHPVIRKGSREWAEWMVYFVHIGHRFGLPNSFANSRGIMTVPCLDPNDFDGGWRARPVAPMQENRVEVWKPSRPALDPETRERISAGFTKLSAELRHAPEAVRARHKMPKKPEKPKETFAEFTARMNSPVSLSPELAQSLGITGDPE